MRTLSLLMLLSWPVAAGVIAPAPPDFVLDGKVGEWRGITPSKALGVEGRSEQTHTFWFARGRRGLVIAGRVSGNPWKEQDRVVIRLSLVESLNLPGLKYDEDSCAQAQRSEEKQSCLAWVAAQKAFRELLEAQTARAWSVGPGAAEEVYALPAYDRLTSAQKKAVGLPRPVAVPSSRFGKDAGGATTFEILVPWEAFPFADRLSIETLRLGVQVNGGFYTRRGDDSELYGVVPPITTRLSMCGQPLLAKDLHGEDQPGYYFLTSSLVSEKMFFFLNPEIPYDTPLPKEGEFSPVVEGQRYSVQELAPGEFLCGPFLSYRKGSVVRSFPVRLEAGDDRVSWQVSPPFPVKKLADGTWLVRYGPDTSGGPLWTKAFEVYSLRIYAMTPGGKATEALDIEVWSDGVEGYEIDVAGDWRTVTEHRQSIKTGKWTAKSFCLTGHAYRECGTVEDAPAPKTRVLTPQN